MSERPNPPLSKSGIHRKVMQFFLDNEGSIDTPRGISTWINENIKVVRTALEELVLSGLLKAHRTSSTVGYSCPFSKKKLVKLLAKTKEKK